MIAVIQEVDRDRDEDDVPDHHIISEVVVVEIVIREVDQDHGGDRYERVTDLPTIGRTLDAPIRHHRHRHRFVENRENRPVRQRQQHQLHRNRLHRMHLSRVVEAH